MVRLFSFARATALAALTLGAGALLVPETADAQGRSGFSGGGGGRSMGGGFSGGGRSMGFSGGGRSMGFAGAGPRGVGVAGSRMVAPRMATGAGGRGYGSRVVAPGVYGGRNVAYGRGGYRYAGVNAQHWGGRPGHRPPHHRPRPPYYGGGGWYGGGYYPYWGVGAGLGLGLASAAYFANDGYYADDCWLERRWVRTNYGRRAMNVRVCYGY